MSPASRTLQMCYFSRRGGTVLIIHTGHRHLGHVATYRINSNQAETNVRDIFSGDFSLWGLLVYVCRTPLNEWCSISLIEHPNIIAKCHGSTLVYWDFACTRNFYGRARQRAHNWQGATLTRVLFGWVFSWRSRWSELLAVTELDTITFSRKNFCEASDECSQSFKDILSICFRLKYFFTFAHFSCIK